MTAKEMIRGVADLVLPRYCAVCGKTLLSKERHLCLGCAVDMPLTYFWTEKFNPMADRLNARLCDEREYSSAFALFFYKGRYRRLTKAVKYKYDLGLGRYLGEALGRKLALCEWMQDVDVIVPVPLHVLRKLWRGYNQASVIAEALTRELNEKIGGATYMPDLLYRSKRTKSQARLRMEQKAANVCGAFAVKSEKMAECPKHIVIVDDVCTSGSTLAECHRALRRALVEKFGNDGGRTRISSVTLAFVGD